MSALKWSLSSVGDWKKNLDASVERFKLAGASKSDISTVLKNHFSNAVSECEEKKVMTSGTEISQTNDNIEDKCVAMFSNRLVGPGRLGTDQAINRD